MLPYVVTHNQVSLDGSYLINHFKFNPEFFYGLANQYEADIFLVGSNTAKTGLEIFLGEIPDEEESDFIKPEPTPGSKCSLWVIPDTRGQLFGLLHMYRRSEHCKSLLILTSKTTPKSYLDYLKERNYDYLEAGDDHVDLKKALELLSERFNAKRVLVDSGSILTNLLLENKLVNEMSIVISPSIAGNKGANLFRNLNTGESFTELKLQKSQAFETGEIHLVYNVIK